MANEEAETGDFKGGGFLRSMCRSNAEFPNQPSRRLFFRFTRCPLACPTHLSSIAVLVPIVICASLENLIVITITSIPRFMRFMRSAQPPPTHPADQYGATSSAPPSECSEFVRNAGGLMSDIPPHQSMVQSSHVVVVVILVDQP